MTIFVVDDEPLMLAVATRTLTLAGWTVAAFPTADAARATLEAGSADPELVVTDCSMPGSMDGLAFARWLARHRPHLPVVVMSGESGALQVASGVASVRSTLAKPFELEALHRAVRAGLAGVAADLTQSDDVAPTSARVASAQGGVSPHDR